MAVADSIKTQMITIGDKEYLRVTLEDKDFDLPFVMISGNKVAFLDISGQVSMIEKSADLLVKKMKEEKL